MAARVLFPKIGFTTDDLLETYEQLSPVLLPHLADRPLTPKRFPDDIHGEAFWEKDVPSFTPKWVKTLPVPRKHEPGVIRYISILDERTLGWAASIGCIEIHAFLHKYPYLTSPTLIAFDLDPGPGASLVDCCDVALRVREWFGSRGLECFAKVSGSKGLQVYVPLNTPTSYSITQPLSKRVAEELEQQRPNKIISRMARAERTGKVFVDWSQNAEHKTTVSAYSVRAKREAPFVSMPVTWDEITAAAAWGKAAALTFTPEQAIARVRERGDLFAPVLTLKQVLSEPLLTELELHPLKTQPKPVSIPRPSTRAYSLPRSSGQGGRKLFVVHSRENGFELGLELDGRFQLLTLEKLPLRKNGTANSEESGMQSLEYFTAQSKSDGLVWDLGTYEVVEGSYAKGNVTVYLRGRKLEGEWVLRKTAEGDWRVTNKTARLKRDLSLESLASRNNGISF